MEHLIPEIKRALTEHYKMFGSYPPYIRLNLTSGMPCELSYKDYWKLINP